MAFMFVSHIRCQSSVAFFSFGQTYLHKGVLGISQLVHPISHDQFSYGFKHELNRKK